jgi:matrixin
MRLKAWPETADTSRMRDFLRILPIFAIVFAFSASSASAARTPHAGFIVLKDMGRTASVVEFRDKATGRIVASSSTSGGKAGNGTACGDSRHKFIGARWATVPTYRINADSVPGYLGQALSRAQLVSAQEAWEGRFRTDCSTIPGRSSFNATDGGNTSRVATLVSELTRDGVNTVSFQSLAGTVCDGALACVVTDYDRGRINEADMAFEEDLTRYGFLDFWTTDSTTWTDSLGGRFAISDVATHEFGHFAGLDHTEKSPELTMYTFIHDGDETLGLGDMKGLLARYSG